MKMNRKIIKNFKKRKKEKGKRKKFVKTFLNFGIILNYHQQRQAFLGPHHMMILLVHH